MEISRAIKSETDENGFVGVQIEGFSDGSPYSELYSFGGYRFVPFDADENGSCAIAQMDDGSDTFAFPGTDPRMIPFLPKPKPGNATNASFDGKNCDFEHFDENGFSIVVHDGEQDHLFSINKQTHTISIIQKDGTAVELNSDGILVRTNNGGFSFSDGKLQVFGDLAFTGSLSQVGGRPLVFADSLIQYLTALEAVVNAKLPAGTVAPISSTLLAPGVGSTVNTLVQ